MYVSSLSPSTHGLDSTVYKAIIFKILESLNNFNLTPKGLEL